MKECGCGKEVKRKIFTSKCLVCGGSVAAEAYQPQEEQDEYEQLRAELAQLVGEMRDLASHPLVQTGGPVGNIISMALMMSVNLIMDVDRNGNCPELLLLINRHPPQPGGCKGILEMYLPGGDINKAKKMLSLALGLIARGEAGEATDTEREEEEPLPC